MEPTSVGRKSNKIPKIKVSKAANDQQERSSYTPEMRRSSTPTKPLPGVRLLPRPQSYPSNPTHTRFARIRSWFSFRKPFSHSNNSKESAASDSTYGFGSRCTSQTYFKTTNVDSNIPNDVDFRMAIAGMIGGDHCMPFDSKPSTNNTNVTTPDTKDILYPLRTSLDGVSSGKKRKQDENNYADHMTNHLSTKRVKFDDKDDVASESFFERRERIHAQQYQQENYVPNFKPQISHQVSLKDRIVDFFSKLI